MTPPHLSANIRIDKNYTIKFTLFRDRFARFKQERTSTLAELAAAITRNKAARKDDLPLVKLAVFGDLASPKGSLRWDNNLTAVTGAELDYDAGKISFDDARLLLLDAGIAAILYTTPSHTEEHQRWRVLAPFSHARTPGERTRMLSRLNGALHGAAHPESFSLSQSYYYGYVTEPPRVDVLEGTPIDLREDLDAGAIGKSGHKSANGDARGSEHFTEMEELIRRIVSSESLHPSVISIAGKLAARGDSKETCIEIIGGAFEAAKADRYTHARWKDDVLRGIDYVYAKEEAKRAQEKTAPEFPAGAPTDDFHYDLERGDYIYTPLMTHWPAKSINANLPKIGEIKPARWLAANKPIHQKVWAPGFPQIIKGKHLLDGGEWLGKEGVHSINSYTPPHIKPGEAHQAGPWLNLITKLYPTPMEHNHLLDTMAFKLQHPEIKINHMIIIGGSKRIGKDTILEPFKRGIGYRNTAVVSPTVIMTEFNKYAQSLLLHISEARDLGETKKTTFAEKLKGLIATPPMVITINDKHKSAYSILNCCLVIATTNHRTDSLYVTEDDGRYFPIWSNVVKEDFSPTEFIELWDWMETGGAEHAIACLLARDVTGYKPKALPPVTDLFLEMVDQSRPVEFDWIGEAIAAQTAQANKKPAALIIEGLASHAEGEAKMFMLNPTKQKFIAFLLEQHGYTKVASPGGSKDGRWETASGRKTIYAMTSLPQRDRENEARKFEVRR